MVSSLTCIQILRFPSLSLRIGSDLEGLCISAGFPVLREFSVDMESLECFPSLMKLISSDGLWQVRISFWDNPTSESLRKAFHALKEHLFKDRSRLVVREPSPMSCHNRRQPELISPLTPSALSALLELKGLCTVSISLVYSYDIDDSFLRYMALAWPQSNELCLLPPSNVSSNSAPPLSRVNAPPRYPLSQS